MKIVIAASFVPTWEDRCATALSDLGHEVIRFCWEKYFQGLMGRAERKYIFNGPNVRRLNHDLVETVNNAKPHFLYVWRGTHVLPETLKKIKNSQNLTLVSNNVDNPFSPLYETSPKLHFRRMWNIFNSCIPVYDLHLAHRESNIASFVKANAKQIELLRPYFIPTLHKPVKLSLEDLEKYSCDVAFVGHYEPDGRLELFEEIVRNGFDFKLFGPGQHWDPVLKKSKALRHLVPVQYPLEEIYNKVLCGAKIALGLLSKLNVDPYAFRSFEIPATKTMMLSEYTDDLSSLFRENEEVVFFRTKEELIQKLKYYLSHDELRQAIAEAGYLRVVKDGHDVESRMKQVLEWVSQLKIGSKG